MKKILLYCLGLFFTACNVNSSGKFSEVSCSKEEMPTFDDIKVSIVDDKGIAIKDTIVDRIEKKRTIFKPCRDYIYQAKFLNKNKNLITNTRIKMTATGNRWEFQPEIQDDIVIQYEYANDDIKKASSHQLNKTLQVLAWEKESHTGIIENVDKIWMHPFRSNQFSFTEVAPFPEIEFPLELGKTWTGSLSIQEGWGDWANTSGSFEYEIVSKETIQTKYGEIENCWKVVSTSSYPFGKSKFDYWFHEEKGFVKMDYVNYGGQYLTIELEEIKDK